VKRLVVNMDPRVKQLLKRYEQLAKKKGISAKEAYELDLQRIKKIMLKVTSDMSILVKTFYKELTKCTNAKCISLKSTWYVKRAKPLLRVVELIRKYLAAQEALSSELQKEETGGVYSFLAAYGLNEVLKRDDTISLFKAFLNVAEAFEEVLRSAKEVINLVRQFNPSKLSFEELKEEVLSEVKSTIESFAEQLETFKTVL